MKSRISILFAFGIFLSACQTTPPLPTATLPASEPATAIPDPTNTPEPSATPITYPDVLDQTFTNIQVIYKDDFEYRIQGEVPKGWVTRDNNALLRKNKDSNFKIDPRTDTIGDIFYFTEESITPGKGVFLTFQYTGANNNFTWGLDNINAQGEFFQFNTDGYYSFAMQMLSTSLSAHVIEGPYLKDDNFNGDLKLIEGTWYNFVIAFDKNDNYIIKIWAPDSPENQLSYTRNWPNSPKEYYFISWIGAERSLWMDDFTIFSFDELAQ